MGLISGTPTTGGTFNVTVTAHDTTGASRSASFSWTVSPTSGGLPISDLSVADTANASRWSIQPDFISGATLYGDRSYTVGTVPPQLQGDAWIRDTNLSRQFTGSLLVTFTINQVATVYVSVDTRIGERP